ncbi:MAG: trypsin-like serine protease [Streptococcaceae bacterium]|jgi:V8-like Glu-specific endopeptidase|nr:trypsin-like serine protease [Streptococcaceae bacterium]
MKRNKMISFVVLLLLGGAASSPFVDAETIISNDGTITEVNTTVGNTTAVKGVDITGFKANMTVDPQPPKSTRTVFGPDDRFRITNTTTYPYSAVVMTRTTFPDGYVASGSGALISPNSVLTAGHNVYDKYHGGWATSIISYPGYNAGATPFGGIYGTNFYSVNGWVGSADSDTKNSYNSRYDIGIIRLASNIGRHTGFFGVSWGAADLNQTFTLTGYPGTVSQSNVLGQMFSASGKVTSQDTNSLYYQIDMTPGDSGGPLYNSAHQIFGVNVVAFLDKNGATKLENFQSFVSAYLGYTPYSALYRLYNSNTGEHFYTIGEAERNSLMAAGWSLEGVGWFAPRSSSNPVYRLYNPNSGLHYYTMSPYEKSSLLTAGWRDEGIGWYSDPNQALPIYVQYNPNSGQHNYTYSTYERDSLIKVGWQDSGTAFYGLAN